MVTRVTPWPLTELISSMPAMVAPGSSAVTWMVGKSTFGSVETGSMR